MRRRSIVWPDAWNVWRKKVSTLGGCLYLGLFLLTGLSVGFYDGMDATSFLMLEVFLVALPSMWFLIVVVTGRWRGWPIRIRTTRFVDGSMASIVGEESLAGRIAVLLPQVMAAPLMITLPFVAFRVSSSSVYMYSKLTFMSLVAVPVGIWLLVRVVYGVGRISHCLLIALTEDGVLYRDDAGSYFCAWRRLGSVQPRHVGQIVPDAGLGPVADPDTGRPSWFEKISRFAKTPTFLYASRVTVNPVVPYVAICFYLRHEELRHELGTPAAAKRITPEGMDEVLHEIEVYGLVRPEYFRPGSTSR